MFVSRAQRTIQTWQTIKKRIATIVIERKFKSDERVGKISERVIKHIYTERKCVYDETQN